MQFIEQLVASDNPLAFCRERQVTPLLSYALVRHFSPGLQADRPLIQLDYLMLYALSAATEPRTLESLLVMALGYMKKDLRREKLDKQVKYARVEYTPESYKARFKHNGEHYVFHLQQHYAFNLQQHGGDEWRMTLCYASDD